MNKLLKILSFLLISVVIFGCESVMGPKYPEERDVKQEVKWVVNPNNDQKIQKVYEIEYNKDGKEVNSKYFNENGKLKSISTYSYDDGDKKEKEVTFNVTGDTNQILIHDYEIKNNKTIKKETYNPNGDLINKSEFQYDNNGNLISKKEYDQYTQTDAVVYDNVYDGNRLKARYAYDSDSESQLISKDSIYYSDDNYFERVNISSSGDINNITRYEFDNFGKIKSEIIKNNNGDILKKYLYEYKYF